MVKIREVDDPFGYWWWVEMYHIGAVGYDPLIFPYDPVLEIALPPWPPGFWPDHGHALFIPTHSPMSPMFNTFRRFDEQYPTPPGEPLVSGEVVAWDFFDQMLGHSYRIISRCRYCFPYGHRYLTI